MQIKIMDVEWGSMINLLKYYIFLFFLAAVFIFALTKKFFMTNLADEIGWSLWVMTSIAYLPVWAAALKEGEISIGPQTVFRYQKPILFWIVVTIHFLICITILLANLYALFL